MSNPKSPESPTPESNESFGQLLSEYEQSHARKGENRQLDATVIAVSDESVFLDIGYKTEGIMPLSAFTETGETVKPGDKLTVTVKGRDPEGYYQVSRFKERRPTDWSALEKAFNDKAVIGGTVTAVVKGGLSVDVGVRAFMPASRSGARDAAEMEKLVGQDIRVRIIKLDVQDEDIVVDRRAVSEEEERATREQRFAQLKEGDMVRGTVRSLTDYGAFVDIGGVDGLLHVGDIAWTRISKPSDVLSVGQEVEARVLKIDRDKNRISLGMKQTTAHPWDAVPEKYKIGDRVRGTVTRIADFGVFVELDAGVEGLVHISEMSWSKRVKNPGDLVKPGESIEAVVLGINTGERRISLGLKQTLGDPWADVAKKFAAGSVVEGPVTSIAKFGAFVQLADGVEGMIHVSEISAEKRINHPQDVLKVGQQVRAQVLSVDVERRLLKLSMKQLVPTSLDEYIAEHNIGDAVSGRVIEVTGDRARVELGEGIQAMCTVTEAALTGQEMTPSAGKVDLSSLSSMLAAQWKGGTSSGATKPEPLRDGQIRSFRITKLNPEAKQIEVAVA